MNDPSVTTDAVLASEVEGVDWAAEFQPLNHPIKTGIRSEATEIYDLKTGTVVAKVEPGYRWYWFHSHLHLCPKNYGRTAEEQNQLRLEGGATGKWKDSKTWLGKAIGDLVKAMSYAPQEEQKQALKNIQTQLEKEYIKF